MIARLFGFDLAGRGEPDLLRGALFAVMAAFARFLPYLVLVFVLHRLVDGVPAVSAVGLLVLLAAAFCVDWLLTAQGLGRSFVATYGLVADMRLAVADRVGRMPLGRVVDRRGAALADLFTDRFSLYQSVATHLWWQIAVTLPMPLLLSVLLFALDWRLGLVVAFFAPLAVSTIPWSFRLLDAATAKIIPARDAAAERVVELVEGAKDLRILDPSGLRRKAAEDAIRDLEARSVATEIAPAPAILAFGLVWWIALAVILAAAALLWSTGRAEPAALLASLVVATRLCGELADLGAFAAEARFGRQILTTIRDLAAEPLQSVAASPRRPRSASVEFDAVSFGYGGPTALRDVTLAVPAGRTVALVGRSGAGKSSLVALMARLWDVERGAVRIGGVDVRDMAIETLNDTVGTVLQDVALFDLSVEDNIRLGRPDATRDEVERAARAARIHDRIALLPDGYATRLDGAGAELSGGERQRIAIARAILKDTPVVVLDEATASIDLENEHLIREALANLSEGRTTIVISHRLRNVVDADQIVVMERGRIVERGSFSALRACEDGPFSSLWHEQEDARGWRLDPAAREAGNAPATR